MIKIKRPTDVPTKLIDAEKRERPKAIKLYRPQGEHGMSAKARSELEKQRKLFKFSAYSASGVKDKLEEMCRLKCAYCESTFRHVYDGDIEHFRPKKAITHIISGQKPKIGYYWLGAEWSNLFLSCLSCNQSRRQVYKSRDGELVQATMGKMNHFPLSSNAVFNKRRTHVGWDSGKFVTEEKYRLLIDPVKDCPERHFSYTREGVIIGLTKKGKASISILGLQRHYLVQERLKLVKLIEAQLYTTKGALVDWVSSKKKIITHDFYKKRFYRQLNMLIKYTRADMPFAGMARFFIYRALEKELRLSSKIIDLIRNKESSTWSTDLTEKDLALPGRLGI